MKRKRPLARSLLTLLLALSLPALPGCGQTGAQSPAPAPAASAQTPAAQTAPAKPPASAQAPAPAQPEPAAPPDDGTVRVGSAEELLEAIAPGAQIVIEPGRYNLSEYIDEFRFQKIYDQWSDEHPCVTLESAYDGVEIVIQNAPGLTIRGGTDDPADTELVLTSRYATVLNFEACDDLTVSGLTMGHTDGGDCTGSVLRLTGCAGASFEKLDLYGCGVYGLVAEDCTGTLRVTDSALRDCEFGPFSITNHAGPIIFTDCSFTGSGWGGTYDGAQTSVIFFEGCTFGEGESNRWYFEDENFYTDCTLSEPTEYPDYSELGSFYEQFDAGALIETPLDPKRLPSCSRWYGYFEVDPQSGETIHLPWADADAVKSLLLWLDEDGTGVIKYGTERTALRWSVLDDSTLCIETKNGNLYASFYENDEYEGAWMLLQRNNRLIWCY